MSRKFALVIGNTEYLDAGLMRLNAPDNDVADFARVLRDPDICGFEDVQVMLNEPASNATEAIDEFFDQKKPDDLLVLYFSGHGVRDEYGSLYLAFKNTIRTRLRATAVKSDYIREAMDQSRSKRQVVILDCCNSGAFPQGAKAAIGGPMGMATAFQGYGRFVLMASDATQFAWEGDKVIGETQNSLFTHFLVKGLEGEADRDADGIITVDELYDYAFDEISSVTSKQSPTKAASKVEGDLVLRSIRRMEDIKPVPLPPDLQDEVEDTRPYVREAAVQKLVKIIHGKNLGMARSAVAALQRIAADENTTRRVALEAARALESYHQLEESIAKDGPPAAAAEAVEGTEAESTAEAAPEQPTPTEVPLSDVAVEAEAKGDATEVPTEMEAALSNLMAEAEANDDATVEPAQTEPAEQLEGQIPSDPNETLYVRRFQPSAILPPAQSPDVVVTAAQAFPEPDLKPGWVMPKSRQETPVAPISQESNRKRWRWIASIAGAIVVGCCVCGLAARFLPAGMLPAFLPAQATATDTATEPTSVLIDFTETAVSPASSTAFQTARPTLTPTITPTPTASTPALTFSQNANCRKGPSTLYEPIGSFQQGQTVEVIGRNDEGPRWWLVAAPGVSKGKCWVSFVTGTTSGPVEDVPITAAPPLPTKTPKPTPTIAPPFIPSIVPTPTV